MPQSVAQLGQCVGKKVSIRLHDGADLRDLVGVLQSEIAIRDRHGDVITFDPAQVVAWREVVITNHKAGTGAPLSRRIHELESAAMATWMPESIGEFGDWILRIDKGFTLRANSVLPTGTPPFGSPGSTLDTALHHVEQRYLEHGLKPAFHISPALYPELDRELHERGWTARTRAVVMVHDVEDFMSEKPHVICEAEPSREWMALDSKSNLESIMRRTSAIYASVTLNEKIAAKARLGFADGWSVLSSLYVAEDVRGKGLARDIIMHLGAMAARSGISKMLLQVELGNSHAINLYESLGFRKHHEYIYRELSPHSAND